MPSFNKYEADGRRLMVEFTCRRCRATHTAPLEDHDKDPESYGYLHRITPPSGWEDMLHGPLLCPDCIQAYREFMKNER